ncbi:aromatic amino acid transport family protein [Exercitatus varius]|uniref:aromatic amino acid transport family protein n=1 Tax=Exercitatus varius TaxID=67857 RepID=UPI00294B66BC|nr:aromatic amino acid transport family protein [Exercitatus varius]MDG2941416.1 aromatic amino acid transporter [Exercitatus varius]
MRNKTFGSALIVAGTTIGAGMVSMPLTSAGMGFGLTLLLLVILWALLAYSALLFVEVYQKAERRDAGIATLAEQYFGMAGRALATVALVVFMFAILTVYVLMSSDLISTILPSLREYGQEISIIFTVFFGIFIIAGTGKVDLATRMLFIAKLAALVVLLFFMLPKVTMENLMALPLDKALLISASPYFFTSFGFHVVIPSINSYLEGDIKRLRIAILGGTALPLFVYILWQMATHGVLSQTEFIQILNNDPTLGGLVSAVTQITGSEMIGWSVRLFSLFALATSFLGVALALFDCLDDLLQRVNIRAGRIALGMFTFLPTLFFALFYRDFLAVLALAGQMFTFYGLILPVGMAWMVRKRYPDLPYRVKGGNITLLLALILGLLIMNVPFLIDMGYLPKVIG